MAGTHRIGTPAHGDGDAIACRGPAERHELLNLLRIDDDRLGGSDDLHDGRVRRGGTGAAPLHYDYEWDRCGAEGANCVPIPGANGLSYTVQAADLGYRLLATLPEVQSTLARLEQSPLAREVLDLPKMHQVLHDLQKQVNPTTTNQCVTILTRGMMAGLFLLRFD